MHWTRLKRWQPFITVLFSMALFFGFGMYHLTKFETVDEHFWKYDRIGDYWDGWKQFVATQNVTKLKKTHINDKPGVIVALVSAPGFSFGPNLEMHRIRDNTTTRDGLFTVYDTEKTEGINFALRFPILLVGVFMLLILFWLVRAATGNSLLASLTVLAIGMSPVLIGMSQIINPDALLWSFFAGALFAFAGLLRTGHWRFLIATALFTGLALLSKYTANILFFLFPMIFFARLIFGSKESDEICDIPKEMRNFLVRYILIVIGAVVTFSMLMPAVFVHPKYLLDGTLHAPGFSGLFSLLEAFLLLIFIDTFFFRSCGTVLLCRFLVRWQEMIRRCTASLVLLILLLPLANIATYAQFIPLENIKENAYSEGELSFSSFNGDAFPIRLLKEIGAESHALVFTIPPLVLALIISLAVLFFVRTPRRNSWLIFSLFLFIPIFVTGALLSSIFLNARYMIILYPVLAFLTAISIVELSEMLPVVSHRAKRTVLPSIVLLFLGTSLWSLYSIKPFFLNYTSALLPKKFSISDAWGYGAYEAAEYLNSIPDIETKTLWADRSGICQFVRAKCINDYKIDLTRVVPNYFVITRRGSLRRPFVWKDPSLAKKSSASYYADAETNWEWALFIDDRPENFIKVIQSEEE